MYHALYCFIFFSFPLGNNCDESGIILVITIRLKGYSVVGLEPVRLHGAERSIHARSMAFPEMEDGLRACIISAGKINFKVHKTNISVDVFLKFSRLTSSKSRE